MRKLVDTLGSDSLNSKALRGTAAGQDTLRKAHAQLHRGGGASAGPEHGTTAWERFSAPLNEEQLIRQQLMIARGSAPGKFKYNGVATLGNELPAGPVSGYKATLPLTLTLDLALTLTLTLALALNLTRPPARARRTPPTTGPTDWADRPAYIPRPT